MGEKIILTDFSGAYRFQRFYDSEDVVFVDAQELPGTNCYCDEEARRSLRDMHKRFGPEGIHFLDSGNYHYMSLLWMEKIREPFFLVVFDNHTDMQPPAFGGLLSCGGWIAEALCALPFLKETVLIGPDGEAFAQVEEEQKERVRFFSRESLKTLSPREKRAFLEELPDGLPCYISVDKDVLKKGDAATSWSQGDMTLKELTDLLGVLLEQKNVIGMDVCGECDFSAGQNGACNERANAALLKLWKNRRESV